MCCASLQSKQTIEYSKPNQYIRAGEQSAISDAEFKEIVRIKLRREQPSIADVSNAYRWKKKHFPFKAEGGAFIGKLDIDQVYAAKQSTGCHDDGLIFVSIMREMNIPAVMVEATGIRWAKNYSQGKQGPYEGHVFAEIYLDSHWILVDPTSGEYIENYDPTDPVIPIQHNDQQLGYYVMEKGLDSWDYGIRSLKDLQDLQERFVARVTTAELRSQKYKIKRL